MLPRDRLLHAIAALGRKDPAAAPGHAPGIEPRQGFPPVALPPREDSLDAEALEKMLRGQWEATEDGPVFVREARFPLDHRHGTFRLGSPTHAPAEAIAALLGGAPAPDVRRLAFLDTETTGLAGGAGTCVFLVGIGTFEEGAFRVRQHFLPAPDGERAMLRLVASELEGTGGLVTYNGRAFDLPALQTRMVLQRLPFGAAALPHFDLLLAMRRLYRNRLPSLRLAEAESRLLGVSREDDIASHLIPSIYFDWVRAGRVGPLRAVLRHNETDILSLVGILSFAADLFSRPDLDPADLILLARWWEHREELERAEAIYESAVPRLEEGPDWHWAARRYAFLLKRSGSRGDAIGLWRRLWARGDLDAGIEVAKYLEHEARDLAAAEEMTSAVLGGAPGPRRAELEHRLSRIRRKLCRAPV